ncbi:MAG: 2-oxoglutarate dehydrogenase E1 component [Bacteroidetes bacterium]|nr:2-oxoglutarate dehydrogenase E1 component [Sphingobacteriaceae bacterium AH-315-L07]PCH67392.1 MAG: 2-oxoglutarate dehydrogenase E1 component [Bacteroidota bacterium]
MDNYSFISNADPKAIEELYQNYKTDPNSVDESWVKFFEGFDFSKEYYGDVEHVPDALEKERQVLNLINSYRTRGHLFTKTNPVRERRQYTPTLELKNFDLSDADLDTVFQAGNELGKGPATLKDIVAHLEKTYCRSVGAEFMFVREPEVVQWLQKFMESTQNSQEFTLNQKKHILRKLNHAVAFEQFLHTKFVGQKRFSLEGCETIIPAIDAVIEIGAQLGIEEFVIGMAHRGRLNILANLLNKSYEEIFAEFEAHAYEDALFDGDVKYHMGFSSDITVESGRKVHLSLAANPSHLETVDPIVEGMARAKLDKKYNGDYKRLAPILVHGDASVAGQGIVYEVIQMSQLEGYKTGGTIHIVLNNQIGFTTNYLDARSSTYCTDVAKVTLSPVFHVNADDVEAVIYVTKLALAFRQKFHRDVFIDMLGYRKHGHNEGDEPKFTQPLLYKIIANHPNPREIYTKKLIDAGSVDAGLAKELEKEFKDMLQGKLDVVKSKKKKKLKVDRSLKGFWRNNKMSTDKDFDKSPDTGVAQKTLLNIGNKIAYVPSDLNFFKKTAKLFDDRKAMLKEDRLDWAMGELLAYGTLLNEGFDIRFTGQDVQRGTFSHRHAVVKLEDSGDEYIALKNISKKQGNFEIYNSLLSEYGVLGYEYGYASVLPNTLTIWEAQFGDFANGAQIIFDQYISSAEDKWLRQNGLVMLLPHGYEGQGPEHSSARLERFLTLCAEDNMQILNLTTPANIFHAFRRQMHRPFRKPMIIFTPKSLLRHPKCVSAVSDFTKGGFKELIDDSEVKATQVKKVLFCSGKIYYDLLAKREEVSNKNTAIVRLEQLYPLPTKQIQGVLKKYKAAKEFAWVQEEPQNMGAWAHIFQHFPDVKLQRISRHESACPATGSSIQHDIQQQNILNSALSGKKSSSAIKKKVSAKKVVSKAKVSANGKVVKKKKTATKSKK